MQIELGKGCISHFKALKRGNDIREKLLAELYPERPHIHFNEIVTFSVNWALQPP